MNGQPLRYLSLFSGIGGFDLGFDRAGMVCAGQVEIDDYCRRVLAKHWPDVKRMADIREVKGDEFGTVDVICGGFPCQPHSTARAKKPPGAEDERDMWPEFIRIIRAVRPQWVVAENVPGLFSSNDRRFFGNILRDLAASGYDAEWQVIPAGAFGLPHRRERVFVVAYANGKRFQECDLPAFSGHAELDPRFIGWNGEWEYQGEPAFLRGDNGVPPRLDRIAQMGNAVAVPVAEWLGRRIAEAQQQEKPQ